MTRNLTLLFALSLLAAGCGDARPEVSDARAEFLRHYPTAEVVDVRMSEDEVMARSFKIAYRSPGDQATKIMELQYMKNDKGVYELRPLPPSKLP